MYYPPKTTGLDVLKEYGCTSFLKIYENGIEIYPVTEYSYKEYFDTFYHIEVRHRPTFLTKEQEKNFLDAQKRNFPFDFISLTKEDIQILEGIYKSYFIYDDKSYHIDKRNFDNFAYSISDVPQNFLQKLIDYEYKVGEDDFHYIPKMITFLAIHKNWPTGVIVYAIKAVENISPLQLGWTPLFFYSQVHHAIINKDYKFKNGFVIGWGEDGYIRPL